MGWILGVYRGQFFSGYRVLRCFFAESEYRVFNKLENWKKCKHSICFVFSYLGSNCLYNVKEIRQMDLNEWYRMCCWNLLSVDNWINHHWSAWQWHMKRNWERTTVIVILLLKKRNLLGLFILPSPSITEYWDTRQIPSTEWLHGTALLSIVHQALTRKSVQVTNCFNDELERPSKGPDPH